MGLDKKVMNENTKFTIIIPTRERADTLEYTLANVVAQDYDNFEVLVSDNASNDNTSEVVRRFMDTHANVKYINTKKRLSMSHNWEFALKHVDEGWMAFLGDDDGLLPGALTYLDGIIKEIGLCAITSAAIGFTWSNTDRQESGRLTMYLNDGFKIIDSDEALRMVVEQGYYYSILPMVYRGFIDSSLFRRAQSITGDFFQSMTPDVYSGLVIALLTEKFGYSNRALTIDGHSSHSGGAAAFSNSERNSKYNPAHKFFMEDNIPFHKDIPLLDNGEVVRSMQAIVYESYLQAAPFHHLKTIKTTHERQLYLILRDAGADFAPMIKDWATKFAAQHDINIVAVYQQVNSLPTRLQKFVRRMHGYWVYLRHIFVIDNCPDLTMRTVYDAGLVAGALLQVRPSLAARAIHVINKARKRFLQC